MPYRLRKQALYIGVTILLLSPACACAQQTAPLESVQQNSPSLTLADYQFLSSFKSFIVHLFGKIHIFGIVNVGSIAVPAATFCPRGSDYPDGCAGAPSANAYAIQHPNFFNGYANQSGQSYVTRPYWNAPGIDYPVGINAATLPSGITVNSLQDPETSCTACSISGTTLTVAGTLVGTWQAGNTVTNSAATVSYGTIVSQLTGTIGGVGTYLLSQPQSISSSAMGVLPIGCTQIARPQVVCSTTSGATTTLNGFDFSLHGGIFFSSLGAGNLLVENSKFVWAGASFSGYIAGTTLTVTSMTSGTIGTVTNLSGAGVTPSTQVVSQLTGTPGGLGTYVVSISQNLGSSASPQAFSTNPYSVYNFAQFGNTGNVTFNNNYLDGMGYTAPQSFAVLIDSGSGAGNFTAAYNYGKDTVARYYNFNNTGTCTLMYNYLEGMVDTNANIVHGEITLASGGACTSSIYSYNTFLQPAYQVQQPGGVLIDVTATFSPYFSAGATTTVALWQLDHNIAVSNYACYSGPGCTGIYAGANGITDSTVLSVLNSGQTYANVVDQANYADTIGAYLCYNLATGIFNGSTIASCSGLNADIELRSGLPILNTAFGDPSTTCPGAY